jgi:hypothetical protein
MALIRRVLRPIVELRDAETITALLMFAYSFLAMTSYTALKPVTRSKFISALGADNLPLVQFAFGIVIGFIMQGYAAGVSRLPRRWSVTSLRSGLMAMTSRRGRAAGATSGTVRFCAWRRAEPPARDAPSCAILGGRIATVALCW